MNILDLIPYGKENAISRKRLADLYGGGEQGDRRARKAIEIARKENVIVNLQDGSGYYRPLDDEGEAVERQLRQVNSRANKINSQRSAIEEWQKEHSGQMALEV